MKANVYILICCLLASSLTGALADYQSVVRPLLRKYCFDCHGEETQKGRIRYDLITEYKSSDQHLWTLVHENLADAEMPPDNKAQPTDEERQIILDWITEQAANALAENANAQRRLNRREFSAALQDVTGLPIDFGAGLPDDAKIDGFDTGAIALQDAADSVAQLLEVTQRAVESIRFLEPDPGKRIRIDFREYEFNDFRKWVDKNYKSQGIFTRSKRLKCIKGAGVYLQTQWAGDRGNSFLAVPAPRDKRAALAMTLRLRSKRPLPGLPIPTLWVKIGGKFMDYRPIGEELETLTYAIRMEDHLVEGDVIKVMLQCFVEVPYAVEGFENDDRSKPEDNIPGGIGTYRPKFDKKQFRTPDVQPVPSIIIESIEIDYDHRAAWPPSTWNVDTGTIGDDDESAQRLLKIWMDRAWRRPATDSDSAKFFALYEKLRAEDLTFDNALRAAFQSVLMGGPFRYLASPADRDPAIAEHAIASKLSFMLAGAPPDKELRDLASKGKLREPAILNAQVDRLLMAPESDAFFEPFVTQWLNMNQPITLVMSHFKKQDFRFGRHLKASLKEETIQYIDRLFVDNRPASELIASDWTMMNDILSIHYGANPLEGGELRKVTLESKRKDPRGGGILGHAGIQSMLTWMGDNWVIYRGAWMLNHVLDDPPPPPPLDVPELNASDESNRGKTFRELLVQHQADHRCSVCHQKMDPLGFAFQNFDLSGRWRDLEYHHYARKELDGKIEWRGEGASRPVDAAGQLPRGEAFNSYVEFKKLLTEHYLDDIVRGMMRKLTLYGTGRQANVLDLATIRSIMSEHANSGYHLKDLTKALVRSRIFLEVPQSETAPTETP